MTTFRTVSVLAMLATTSLLASCADVGIGLGAGNYGGGLSWGGGINVPIGGYNSRRVRDLNVTEQQIVRYFAPAAQNYRASDTPIRGGFYRQLIRQNGSQWLVQDFYQDSGRKYTDPVWIDAAHAERFALLPDNGTVTTYHDNGRTAGSEVFQNRQLISSSRFDINGQVVR